MSIKSQLERIKSNVDNSLLEVQAKGVAVPDDANSDNLPGLIAQISGGDATVEEITNEAGGKSVYINSEVPKLPEGYTRLKYIQSSGTQYVDTGFAPDSNTRVVMDLQGATTTSGVYMHYGVTNFMAGKASSSSWNYYAYYGTQELAYSTRTASDFVTRHTVDQNKNVITTGANTATMTTATFSSSYNMYLFGVNNNGSLAYASPIRVFSCQIYDNGTLVRDYVPCLNAENVAGLYDMVNGVFYADAAGGAFVAGPVVMEYELPEGYTRLKYIQSTGSQYVDTGVSLSSATIPNLRVVADIELVYESGKWCVTGSGGTFPIVYFGVNNAGKIAYGDGATDIATSSAYTQGRYTWDYDIKNQRFIVGGTSVTSIAIDASGSGSRNFFISAYATSATAATCHKEIIYGYLFYDNDVLVRDYVPCLNEGGVAGLYDFVSGVFYGDAAGVGFIAGPAVGKPGVSKVVLEDEVLIDLTGDTVTPESLLSGFSAHNAMGQMIQGAASAGKPCAKGSLTQASLSGSFTVSGLGFQPKSVFIAWGAWGRQPYDTLASAYLEEGSNIISATFDRYDSSYNINIFTFAQSDYYIKINSDGFMVRVQAGTYVSGTYRWFAVG